MYLFVMFIESLHEYLTGKKYISGNIIRKHSKRVDQVGDVSFPLNITRWTRVVEARSPKETQSTILDYLSPGQGVSCQLERLTKESTNWALNIEHFQINKGDVHLYLTRSNTITLCVKDIIKDGEKYGLVDTYFVNKITITLDESVGADNSQVTLTDLRASITQNVTSNIVNHLTNNNPKGEINIKITLNSMKNQNSVLCGAVLNDNGVKSTKPTATELQKKRAMDMQLMAQHKYGIQVKPSWGNYFEKLGVASVVLEMLQNKTHKATKITSNKPQTTNKGPSFIFYNCARLSALFKEFDRRVSSKVYPELPPVDKVDFGLLIQPEEWEMIFVFALRFPQTVISCVCDIESGLINLHNLVSFLSNVSATFSVYYRRVKILTNARDHLFPVLFARIYLLKAVQQVFHNGLQLLGIEPIKEM